MKILIDEKDCDEIKKRWIKESKEIILNLTATDLQVLLNTGKSLKFKLGFNVDSSLRLR